MRRPARLLEPYGAYVRGGDELRALPAGAKPVGHRNVGNSCYANATLSALAATRPLAAYCVSAAHSSSCEKEANGGGAKSWCAACELERHVRSCVESSKAVSPAALCKRVRALGSAMGYGRQEDAHEFVRSLLYAAFKCMLEPHGGEQRLREREAETTALHHIFGGYTRSRVACCACGAVSDRYENFLDLAVELANGSKTTTLEKALRHFTAPEWLDGENKYKCDKCNALVRAQKRLSVHTAPNVLVVGLKRYTMSMFGKNNAKVAYPETLDLAPYMSYFQAGPTSGGSVAASKRVNAEGVGGSGSGHSRGDSAGSGGDKRAEAGAEAREGEGSDQARNANGETKRPLSAGDIQPVDCARAKYSLYAVVEHMGSSFGGHYVAYVKAGSQWYQVDDSRVRTSSWEEVRRINAYMLYYERANRRHAPLVPGEEVPEPLPEDVPSDFDSSSDDEGGDGCGPSGDPVRASHSSSGSGDSASSIDAVSMAFDAAFDALGAMTLSSSDDIETGSDSDGMGGRPVPKAIANPKPEVTIPAVLDGRSQNGSVCTGASNHKPEEGSAASIVESGVALTLAAGAATDEAAPRGPMQDASAHVSAPAQQSVALASLEPPICTTVGAGAAQKYQMVFTLPQIASKDDVAVRVMDDDDLLEVQAGSACGEFRLPFRSSEEHIQLRWSQRMRMLSVVCGRRPTPEPFAGLHDVD